jgi:hypothetical protein
MSPQAIARRLERAAALHRAALELRAARRQAEELGRVGRPGRKTEGDAAAGRAGAAGQEEPP